MDQKTKDPCTLSKIHKSLEPRGPRVSCVPRAQQEKHLKMQMSAVLVMTVAFVVCNGLGRGRPPAPQKKASSSSTSSTPPPAPVKPAPAKKEFGGMLDFLKSDVPYQDFEAPRVPDDPLKKLFKGDDTSGKKRAAPAKKDAKPAVTASGSPTEARPVVGKRTETRSGPPKTVRVAPVKAPSPPPAEVKKVAAKSSPPTPADEMSSRSTLR